MLLRSSDFKLDLSLIFKRQGLFSKSFGKELKSLRKLDGAVKKGSLEA